MNLPPNRARWPNWAEEEFNERAAIREFQGNVPRDVAEYHAEVEIRKLALSRDREGKERQGA